MAPGFFALIASLLLFVATPALAGGVCEQEGPLLHRRVDLSSLLRFMPQGRWQPYRAEPRCLLVVHLFSEDCPACVREFPLWRKMLLAWQGRKEIGFLFLLDSDRGDDEGALAFFRKYLADLPEQPPMRTADGRLRAALENESKPITLLLDRHFIVRQAFVGSIEFRRNELVSALRRLRAAAALDAPECAGPGS